MNVYISLQFIKSKFVYKIWTGVTPKLNFHLYATLFSFSDLLGTSRCLNEGIKDLEELQGKITYLPTNIIKKKKNKN